MTSHIEVVLLMARGALWHVIAKGASVFPVDIGPLDAVVVSPTVLAAISALIWMSFVLSDPLMQRRFLDRQSSPSRIPSVLHFLRDGCSRFLRMVMSKKKRPTFHWGNVTKLSPKFSS